MLQTSVGYMSLDDQALAEAPEPGVKIHTPNAEHQDAMKAFVAADRANIIAKAEGQLGLPDAEARLATFTGPIEK